ncbi:MAG: hypothetical protein JO206_09880 [Solirubrobacterales bacterium]|nr:hypothetical protein [Solirubrobacterales bacterium]MBV9473266.1 hypothetical protein [Solirubrobacterales bacterium]
MPRLEGTAPGALDRALAMRGALEDTIGRSSTSCSRAQIGQFWTSRLWRQNVGRPGSLHARRARSLRQAAAVSL